MTRVEIEKFRGLFEKHKAICGEYILTGLGMASAVVIAKYGYLPPKRKSNNWLKMHGYPMRRKKRRRS